MMKNVRSPLRYPGGKSRAIARILERLPKSIDRFREPFVGGGSVFLAVRQRWPHASIWINDLNPEVAVFWRVVATDGEKLVDRVREIHRTARDGRKLFRDLTNNFRPAYLSDVDRAVRFFVLNRITFSGTIEAGGYSESAFKDRFTPSSIDRLEATIPLLCGDVKITCGDYTALLEADGDGAIAIFLDPPYYKARRLYGRKGELHESFDHQRFAENLHFCRHSWLLTYDDCPQSRQALAGFASIEPWTLQYGTNASGRSKAKVGNEIFAVPKRVEKNRGCL